MKPSKTVLVAPLDWGLGHSSRCVTIINKLLDAQADVILGGNGRALIFLQREFPNLRSIEIPGFQIKYSQKINASVKILSQIPGFLKSIKKENRQLDLIVKENNIDVIISDNRYGLWNEHAKSILITHQLNLKMPANLYFLRFIPKLFIRKLIKNFDECWIPDYEGKINLSGDLAHSYKLPANAHFIGPLSRFHEDIVCEESHENLEYVNDILVILSGPEPQRSIFEKQVLEQLKNSELKAVIIQGIPETNQTYELSPGVTVFSNRNTQQMSQLICESNLVLSRPGYSSIMDLTAFGRKAIFVPTPGQTEQEYLAKYFKTKKIFYSIKQNKFNLNYALDQVDNYTGIKLKYNPALLEDRIKLLLEE